MRILPIELSLLKYYKRKSQKLFLLKPSLIKKLLIKKDASETLPHHRSKNSQLKNILLFIESLASLFFPFIWRYIEVEYKQSFQTKIPRKNLFKHKTQYTFTRNYGGCINKKHFHSVEVKLINKILNELMKFKKLTYLFERR